MCWSGQASAVLATIGTLSTAYAAYKKEPTTLWVCLGYFTLMEWLQAFTYSVIDNCALPENQIATLLGYLHISFQPFFINAVSLHFIDQRVARKIEAPVYMLCFTVSILMLIQLYPFTWAPPCQVSQDPLCSDILCSMHGNWHIAWYVPTTGVLGTLPVYAFIAFAIPVLYGSWRFTLYHLLVGPLLAQATTSNSHEWPAVWCLFSIGMLLLVLKTPLRQILYVRSWPLWPKQFRAPQTPGEPAIPAPFGSQSEGAH
jgi:hypothetical protein